MPEEQFEIFKQKIKTVSDDKLAEVFSKGVLRLTDEQVATVSFVFWLCYIAETDLNMVITESWEMSKQITSFPNQAEVIEYIKGMGFDFEKLEYLKDKIIIYEKLFGKTDRTKLLWKINDIRNHLSHNRLDKLTYNDEGLYSRETKEKIILDYFETSQKSDFSKSKIWNDLTSEQQEEIAKLSNKYLQNDK